MRHFLTLNDLNQKEIMDLVKNALEIKKKPEKYSKKLSGKNLVLLLETLSLRTRLSFEIGMQQLGGNAITYAKGESTLGKKETIKDFAKVVSSYADFIAARIFSHEDLEELAQNSSVPVINAMTNLAHPCQALGDLLTIFESKKKFKGINLAYFGDANNNVTHSLMLASALTGMNIMVASPKTKEFLPQKSVIDLANKIARKTGSQVIITSDPEKAVKDADFVYTDSWMSYRISPSREKARMQALKNFQVNDSLLKKAKGAKFMHCLPVKRGSEATESVVGGKNSIIYRQAENRLHAQKSLLLMLQRKS